MKIKQYLYEMEDSANKNRSEITKIYNDMRHKIIERESQLKKQISETLDREQIIYKKKISQLENQLDSISDLKESKIAIGNENAIDTLLSAVLRYDLENEANLKIETLAFGNVFKEVKREEELAIMLKILVPQSMRSTLLTGTVS